MLIVHYLLAIFDAIMNTMTKANGKKVSLVFLSGVLSLYFHLKYCKSAAASFSLTRLLFHHVFNTDLDVQIGEFIGTVCWPATMVVVGYIYIYLYDTHSLVCHGTYCVLHSIYSDGNVSISRSAPVILRQGKTLVHLPGPGSSRCMFVVHEDTCR